MKILLKNEFHGTSMYVIPKKPIGEFGGQKAIEISRALNNKIKRSLCPHSNCGCGATYGKGPWVFSRTVNYETKFYIMIE